MGNRENIYITSHGIKKFVGFISWDKGIYFSKREEEHQFHKFGDGFGMSEFILDYLEGKGIKNIIIIFKGEFLRATTGKFFYRGNEYLDGSDLQFILPLSLFEKDKTIKLVEIQEVL